MKTLILALPVFLLPVLANAQAERAPYNQVEQICRDWDPVRGPWLSNSLQSMSERLEVPDRTFPERFTPNQMLRMMPAQSRNQILTIATNERDQGNDPEFWGDIQRYVRNAGCGTSSGRTYGDPHLVSFDGARNSFQTVGEFTLTESSSGDMVVQTRQKATSEDFSLNTAVAMNVAGDRVCIYTQDFPDGDYSTPLRLAGRPLHLNGSTYALDHGGTIKKVGKDYTIYWPTGESVTAQIGRSGNFEFVNVTVQVNDCAVDSYNGLLGNANGTARDDFSNAGVSPVWGPNDDYADRKRQEYMAKDFAELHRITQQESLFDYIVGRNTLTYTDRSFPRVYRDLTDLNSRQLGKAQRYCESQNIDRRDLNACIYDNAYLGIEAAPAPTVPDPVQGTVLRPVEVQEPVSRPTGGGDTPRPLNGKETDRDTPVSSPGRTTTEPVSRPVEVDKPVTRPEPVSRPEPPAPRPQPRPEPRPEPRPQPTPTPRPTPAPVQKPSTPTPTPTPRGGGRG